MDREILLGDEAIGLGAIHSGLSGVYGYPGTPSTEIFEFVERRTKKAGDVHAFWSTNEKVAYEEARRPQRRRRRVHELRRHRHQRRPRPRRRGRPRHALLSE